MAMREDTLTITVTIRVPVNGINVNALEGQVGEEILGGICRGVRQMQEEYQRRHADLLERREWKSRQLVTRFGTVRLEMLKVRNRETGETSLLGNDLLELAPRQRMTLSVEKQAVSLRVRGLSYRQSGEVLGDMGIDASAMAIWRRVQARGKQRCRIEQAEQARVFARKEATTASSPPYLFLEADEIHVGAQRSATDSHRIKTGLSYTSREPVKGYSKPRHRLAQKRVYGGVESLETFGRGWYSLLERQYAVSRAKAILYLTDGDPGLIGIRESHFPEAIHAHDRAHVFRDIGAGAPNEACRKRWISWLCAGKWEQARRAMRQSLKRDSGSAKELRKVLRVKRMDFYGTKIFRRLYDPQRTQRLPYATGGVEKNQEITIGRAMKKRGMAWTAQGAHHLAKLVFAFQHKHTWESLWMEPPPLT